MRFARRRASAVGGLLRAGRRPAALAARRRAPRGAARAPRAGAAAGSRASPPGRPNRPRMSALQPRSGSGQRRLSSARSGIPTTRMGGGRASPVPRCETVGFQGLAGMRPTRRAQLRALHLQAVCCTRRPRLVMVASPGAPARGQEIAVLESIVIVGASLAGLRCAEALRGQGYAGRLALVGAEARIPVRPAAPLEGGAARRARRAEPRARSSPRRSRRSRSTCASAARPLRSTSPREPSCSRAASGSASTGW